MKISEVMTAPPVCVAPHDPLTEVTGQMAEHTVGSVLGVEHGALHGMVTERDLAVRGLGGGLGTSAQVDRVMSPRVTTVEAADELQVAYRTFRRTGIHRLPVLEAGRVVGVLTIDDLLLDVFRRLSDLLGPVTWNVLKEPSAPPPSAGPPG
jgi:CBS domain-containing protein